ncbi:DUF2357 domain-containing protein [Chitinophaga pinensis]|uniref:DUF2357 domain-containing protein n=1 Tax=Chitinophaga pinensis (strain ATCC 43595 / DSM 2588 / LMG 13176 / NBRC 15968 / NCIMB 11800 / UQM 2034) TaxID=485918 RepID=A0A979G1F8_CHIPD|nr:DUF2357 domain-containing protein [Chitinophaga pinensis]ACU58951.1 protein of unknown function DUF524 [Chitinophaga pinensis DSM 2588]
MHILSVKHEHFSLVVALADGRDVAAFEEMFQIARQRHLESNLVTAYVCSAGKCIFCIWNPKSHCFEEISMLQANYPVIFDTIRYKFTLSFHRDVLHPSVYTKLDSLDGLFQMQKTNDNTFVSPAVLDFRNEPGDFELVLHYQYKTIPHRVAFEFQVYAVNLDFKRDLPAMQRSVEVIHPRLFIDHLKKTSHPFESCGTDDSAILWWTNFRNLFRSIVRNVKAVVDDPHTNPEIEMKRVKVTAVVNPRNKLSDKLEMFEGKPGHFFDTIGQSLMEDNYENRFVKHIIKDILSTYRDVYQKLTRDSSFKRIAREYRIQLEFSAEALSSLLKRSFLKDIKSFDGEPLHSQIMQAHPGYAGLKKDWETLRKGYQLLDGLYEMELKDVGYMYKVWTFFGMADLIRQVTGVSPEIHKMAAIKKKAVGIVPQKDVQSKMTFHCPDEIVVELYQEPHYTGDFTDTIAGGQEEEICLHIIMKVGKKGQHPDLYQTYIFDPKYRLIASKEYDNIDIPLESDIRQLNNYRRVFYNKPKENGGHGYKKEIAAAYILFPGREAGTAYKKYYDEVILPKDEGGFAFLPYHKEGKNLLKKHLRKLIKEDSKTHLQHILNPESPGIELMEAYVIVIPVKVNDVTLIETAASQVATLYPIRQLDPAIGERRVLRVAPYFEGQGIICYYDITAIHIKAWRDIYPPTHPLFRDEGRRYVVLTLKNKVMLDDYVRIKGMANNKRYTQIKFLYRPVNGFIMTVPGTEVLGTVRKSPRKG